MQAHGEVSHLYCMYCTANIAAEMVSKYMYYGENGNLFCEFSVVV